MHMVTGEHFFIHGGDGEHMSNTIELLEAIGRDASLRQAPPEGLLHALDSMDASVNLKMAAASGDRSHLAQELGAKVNLAVQVNHNPGQGGEPDDMESEPDRDESEADTPENQ